MRQKYEITIDKNIKSQHNNIIYKTKKMKEKT